MHDPTLFSNDRWDTIKEIRKDIKLSPFKVLPNVSMFKVKSLGKYHPILKWFGIFKRMRPATFEKSQNKNGRLNRYLWKMEKYLNKSAGESKFWTVGLILLSRSTSFRMTQLIQTHPK